MVFFKCFEFSVFQESHGRCQEEREAGTIRLHTSSFVYFEQKVNISTLFFLFFYIDLGILITVVHASGTGQLQADPPVADLTLPSGNPT